MAVQQLDIRKIIVDRGVLPRAHTVRKVVERYEAQLRIVTMPPLVVFHDGKKYWLADGEHRLEAHIAIEDKEVPCDVRSGTLSDARWYAAHANAEHGQPLTMAERKRAAEILLNDRTLRKYSDGQIASQTTCSVSMINQLRHKLDKQKRRKPKTTRIAKTKTGAEYEIDVSTRGGKGPGRPTLAQQEARAKAEHTDGRGETVPETLHEIAAESVLLDEINTRVSELLKFVDTVHKNRCGVGQFLDVEMIGAWCQEIRKSVKRARFYCPCPECEHKTVPPKSCRCKGAGWLTRAQFQETVQ